MLFNNINYLSKEEVKSLLLSASRNEIIIPISLFKKLMKKVANSSIPDK